jgi:hypothetical protein
MLDDGHYVKICSGNEEEIWGKILCVRNFILIL